MNALLIKCLLLFVLFEIVDLMGEEGEAKTDAKPEKVKIRRVHICNANGTPLFKHPESKHHESNTPEEQKLDNTLVFEKDLEETGLKAKLSEQFNIPLGQIVSVKPRSTHKAISNIREQKCPIPIPTHLFAKLKKEAEKYLNWGERHRGYMFVESNLYLELVDLHSNPPKSLFTILDYVRDSPAQSPADSQTAETTLKFKRGKTGADLAEDIILRKFGPASIALKDMLDGRKVPIGYQDVISHVYGNRVFVEYELAPLSSKFEYRRRRTMTLPQDKETKNS